MTDPLSEPAAPSWNAAKRFGFRALVIYFLLYTLPFPLTYVPVLGGLLGQGVDAGWKSLGPWVGDKLLGLGGHMFVGPTGSGDTTLDYVKLLIMSVIAMAGASAWSIFDRRGISHPRLAGWLVVGVRFYLGVTMLSYGWAKLIPLQFPLPSLTRLLTPYGESSPMGLLWTFMGFSPIYGAFTGAGEVIGGMLVFFNRTKTLGAAILIAVLSNIVLLNFTYDVPVKLYSSHLLLMAVGLFALDWQRVSALFLRNVTAPPALHTRLFASKRANQALVAVGVLLVGAATVQNVTRGLVGYRTFGAGRETPPLWGIHDVESFVQEGEEVPPLLSDSTRWHALVVDRPLPTVFGGSEQPGTIGVLHMDGQVSFHTVEIELETRTLSFPQGGEDVLRWERPSPDLLVMTGMWGGLSTEIRLKERDLSESNLTGRGYHWIAETPFNR